mmetsp:Transcript_15449/g.22036  ORF Transcript_15449/g.22036 Transcript_15449/m.22036 type:complete len:100 (+) Transcript_15449:767-1066(+)
MPFTLVAISSALMPAEFEIVNGIVKVETLGRDGEIDGLEDGVKVTLSEVGALVGLFEGKEVGNKLGYELGKKLGSMVGEVDGETVIIFLISNIVSSQNS